MKHPRDPVIYGSKNKILTEINEMKLQQTGENK